MLTKTVEYKTMSKLVTIKAPIKGVKQQTNVSGYVVKLYVGQYQHKFLLQQTPYNETFLTHFGSGQKLGSVSHCKMMDFIHYGNKNPTDREIAKKLIDDLIHRHGVDRVNEIINLAPIIN